MHSLIENITKETTPPELIKIYQDYLTNNASLKELYEYHKNTQIGFLENITSEAQSRAYFEETINSANVSSKLIGLSEMMHNKYYKSIINTQGSESKSMNDIKNDVLASMGDTLNKKQLFQIWRIKEMIFACEAIFQKSKHIEPLYYYIFGLAIRELLVLGFTGFDELKMSPIMGTNDISSLSHRIEREYVAQFHNYHAVANDIEKRVLNITSIHDHYAIDSDTSKILGNILGSKVKNVHMIYPDLQKFTLSKNI